MHARALLSIHRFPPPLAAWSRFHVLLALLFIALSSLLPALLPIPLHAAPRLATCPTGSVVYVAKDAPGIQTGNSGFAAFVSVQDALVAAAACPGVQQIWVKEGVYYPDDGKSQVANSAAASFVVPPG